MQTGFSMNNGIVNWPEIKTRRIRPNSPTAQAQPGPRDGREKGVLMLVATNLEQFKEKIVQTIQRL